VSNHACLRIFVLIDALGWCFLQKQEFLSDLLPCQMPLRTVLGFSSGAIPTILTGVPPQQHGHWNLFYYDPQHSPFRWLRTVQFLPNKVLDHRVSRRVVKEIGRRVLGLGPLFECCVSPQFLPSFNWIEKRNIYDRGGIVGARSIFDRLADTKVPFRVYSYHQGADKQILKQAQQDITAERQGFFFVYLSEFDLFLHNNCNDSNRWKTQLEWYASRLSELFRAAASLNPQASFTVFSDHGMTPVTEHFDLAKEIDGLNMRPGRDYLVVYDSTMARFWFFTDEARARITELMDRLECGRILSDQQLQEFGVFFPDRRYGELIFLMNAGWLIAKSDFNGKGWAPAGMHGYDPSDPYSDAVFLSNREPRIPMHSVTDVYRCMQEAIPA